MIEIFVGFEACFVKWFIALRLVLFFYKGILNDCWRNDGFDHLEMKVYELGFGYSILWVSNDCCNLVRIKIVDLVEKMKFTWG